MGFFLVGEVTESRFLQVIFSEPIVITACEFLEQSASSVAQAVSLVGYVTFVFFFFFLSWFGMIEGWGYLLAWCC